MTVDAPFSLEEMADRLAIQHSIARYVHALDAHDIDTLDDVFMPDAEFDLTSAGGMRAPWSEIKKYFETTHQEKFAKDFHHFSNMLIDLHGDTATSRTKVINPRELPEVDGVAPKQIAVGVYTDEWVRSADGWRIAKRTWARAFVIDC